MSTEQIESTKRVRHFRQILLWPLQLAPIREGAQIQAHWALPEKGRVILTTTCTVAGTVVIEGDALVMPTSRAARAQVQRPKVTRR